MEKSGFGRWWVKSGFRCLSRFFFYFFLSSKTGIARPPIETLHRNRELGQSHNKLKKCIFFFLFLFFCKEN